MVGKTGFLEKILPPLYLPHFPYEEKSGFHPRQARWKKSDLRNSPPGHHLLNILRHRKTAKGARIIRIANQKIDVHAAITTLVLARLKVEFRKYLCVPSTCKTKNEEAGPDVLNIAGSWAALSPGIGFYHFENMLGTLSVPAMNHNTFTKNESFVEKKSISEAGKEERLLAEERGNVDSDGVCFTTVNVDGGGAMATTTTHQVWRSTGEIGDPRENPPSCGILPVGFPRAKTEVTPPRIEPRPPLWEVSGLVARLQRPPKAVIGELTGNTLLYANGQRDNAPAKTHVCYNNWDNNTPSTAMEQDIVEGFRSSEQMHGMQYKHFVGDGDSSVRARLLQNVPYGRSIHNIECTNHCIINYTSRLHTLAADKTSAADARKVYRGCAGEQESNLVRDLENGPYHVFGQHGRCRSHFCHKEEGEKGTLERIKKSGLLEEVSDLVQHLKGSFQRQRYVAGPQFQKRQSWELSPLKKLTGRCPGQTQKKILNKKIERQNARKRRGLISAPSDTDCGPEAEQPED
ncbi:hypothetical protein PR048_004028 [Dryococelus australis]|uniref:Mutator-like transposase domain-containing protein n=1 Tax=Dryococelus australis TaxID=614101 RepID=A0ABQ9I4E3_9NEOP|nr:hypothetical protein PR048_004028 [Dryococelus australis]